jgi:hypothetical protein
MEIVSQFGYRRPGVGGYRETVTTAYESAESDVDRRDGYDSFSSAA